MTRTLRRLARLFALALAVGAVLIPATAAHAAIAVEGEAATATNIATVRDAEASGGKYLLLDTLTTPPSSGWYASFTVRAATAGIYRLEATVGTHLTDHSELNLSVNGSPYQQVARSNAQWADYPFPWGDLQDVPLKDVKLNAGSNTIRFMADEPWIRPVFGTYRFALDDFTLTPVAPAIRAVRVGNPTQTLGVVDAGTAANVRLILNGPAPTTQSVRYTVRNYFDQIVASGTATVPTGLKCAVVTLNGLAPGNYRVSATLDGSTEPARAGAFTVLPVRPPVDGTANRFGVMTLALELVPSSRLDAFVLGMRQMGAHYVREEINWPLIEPEPGRHDAGPFAALARTFADAGLAVLQFWGTGEGTQAPEWAMTETSRPLPDDLRDGYTFAGRIAASQTASTLEVWNEPEQESFCCSTGDQIAAYSKAALLGIEDTDNPPLAALPPFFSEGPIQELMLQNEVARYADVWSFHSYPTSPPVRGLTPFPPQTAIQRELRERYDGRALKQWATEAGLFTLAQPEVDLTFAQQIAQARYLVQSAVQDLAGGTERHMWFIGPPCCSFYGVYFSLVNREFQPLPSYSAHAAMTSLLGEANFVRRLPGLPADTFGFQFKSGSRAISVLWAATPTSVSVPVTARSASLYDVMGNPQAPPTVAGGAVRVTASLDPVYVVSDGAEGLSARPSASDVRTRPALTEADHIVLAQRYAAANAAPEKNQDEPGPYGYELGRRTAMTVDVYNLNDTAKTVTVSGSAFGAWSLVNPRPASVTVPANGRVAVPFTILAGTGVQAGVDHPLVFKATMGSARVAPSVSRIQLATTGEPGAPIALAPTVALEAPLDGATVAGPQIDIEASISDALSGVDPARIEVRVDGTLVAHSYDARSGTLTASPTVGPGTHRVWVRAYNNALAPSAAAAFVHTTR